jgi:hypothetical protein
MGSLADELGDVWGEDAVDDHGSSFLEGLREGSSEPVSLSQRPEHSMNLADMHDFGMGIPVQSPQPTSPVQRHSKKLSRPNALTPQSNGHPTTPSRHRKTESQYDGSDYGPDSDPEDLPPTLLRRISDIESLTRISAHADDVLGENGGIIARTTAGLKDLGPQASIENGTTRLITAYSSMSTHRTHKTKELLSQSHSLLFAPQAYGSAVPWRAQLLEEDVLEDLLGSVEELRDCVPVSAAGGPNPLLSLQILVSNTAELVYALRSLADVLQEAKVAAAAAGRRLKSVKELVAEMRVEEELRAEGVRWIENGDWERRLQRRDCEKVCGDVVRGFERVCEDWRERLLRSAEASGGGGLGVEVGA